MARFRHTEQHQRRFRDRQHELLEKKAGETGAGEPAGRDGQVISHHGRELLVEDAQTGETLRCVARRTLGTVVTGDRVLWVEEAHGNGAIVAVRPRISLLQRPDPYGKPKSVAANIDQVLIVVAPRPEPNPTLIDRYIVATLALPATPILVLNKTDLPETGACRRLLDEFAALGIERIETRALAERPDPSMDDGLDTLRARLAGHISLLAGQSGVGKSSLVRQLVPAAAPAVGDLSDQSGEGRHTTRASTLYHLPAGGDLIDSPGVRDFGLWEISPDDLARGFTDIREHADQCRFANCKHRDEPGCAVRHAAEQGKLSLRRLHSYLSLLETLETERR